MPRRLRTGKNGSLGPGGALVRVEELVLASSGADAFELVFTLAAALLFARAHARAVIGGAMLRHEVLGLLHGARRAWPELEIDTDLSVPDATLAEVVALLDRAALDADAEGLDALFEQLVTRVGKGQKGQFFTPRHVVDFAVRALGLSDGERFLDPACGSGAFVVHARAAARVQAWGYDVDARAVRVARLLAIATGGDPARILRRDSLAEQSVRARFDAIATNPPFAGVRSKAEPARFEVARLGGRVERDALFLERCLSLLRPSGRLAIIVPHGKVAGGAWAPLRRWLVARARVLAVVSLPRETFLPHTSQHAALVLARKRSRREAQPDERIFLGVSERAGRNAGGDPVLRAGAGREGVMRWRDHDHDLGEIEGPLREFLKEAGFDGR